MESPISVDPNIELRSLLNGGLPLDRVGHRLRYAARRAARSGDVQRMRAVAKVIISELQRQGDRSLVSENLPTPQPHTQNSTVGFFDFDHMLEAMKIAQDLTVGDTSSGEAGVVLESILDLLQQFVPQFELHILLFDETELSEVQDRVFSLKPIADTPSWLGQRVANESVFIPTADDLPSNITGSRERGPEFSSAVAIPLYEPMGSQPDSEDVREVGLVFLLARENLSRDTALRLGTKLSRFITHRWHVHRELNKKIHIDALTGLFNRRYFDGHFPLLLERAKRNDTPLTLIIADIDLFKTINTDFGLLVGDQVLQMVARRLQEEVRRVDVVCRRGGEEFVIILPETGFDAAQEVINRLLNAAFVLMTEPEGQKSEIKVSLSYGVTIFPENGVDDEQLHYQAEASMFMAKDTGRDRCCIWRNDGEHFWVRPG